MILLNSGRNGGQTRPFAAGGRKGNELRRPHERLVNLMHSNAICKSAPYGHPRNRPARLCPLPALGMPQLPKLKVAGQMPPSCPEPAMPSGRASPCRPMQVGPHLLLPHGLCRSIRTGHCQRSCAWQIAARFCNTHQAVTAANQHGDTLPCVALALTMAR